MLLLVTKAYLPVTSSTLPATFTVPARLTAPEELNRLPTPRFRPPLLMLRL